MLLEEFWSIDRCFGESLTSRVGECWVDTPSVRILLLSKPRVSPSSFKVLVGRYRSHPIFFKILVVVSDRVIPRAFLCSKEILK